MIVSARAAVRLLGLLGLVALLAGIVGCIPETTPSGEACARASIEVDLRLDVEGLEPGSPSVCRDQEVTFIVRSDVDGVLHVHGYDDEVPAFEVSAGETTEITFTAGRSGQFPIEFHPAEDPEGIAVGVFTVHEP